MSAPDGVVPGLVSVGSTYTVLPEGAGQLVQTLSTQTLPPSPQSVFEQQSPVTHRLPPGLPAGQQRSAGLAAHRAPTLVQTAVTQFPVEISQIVPVFTSI